MNPRTHNHMLSELLQLVMDDEWSGQYNKACCLHPEYISSCSHCKALEDDTVHKNDCKRMLLIKEVRAYLEVEASMLEENGEEVDFYIP